MTDAVICFTTTNSEKEAKKLARAIVGDKLAACVNLLPKIRSFYEWDGAIRDETEYLLIIKTTGSKVSSLSDFINHTHSYECPEFIALDIADGLPAYLQWIDDVTR